MAGLIISGWWYTYPTEKYEFVSLDDDIPNMMGKSQSIHVPHHQPDIRWYKYKTKKTNHVLQCINHMLAIYSPRIDHIN